MAIDVLVEDGVAEVVINNPPVNALDSAGWREFADSVTALGQRDDVNCLVIRAEGRGYTTIATRLNKLGLRSARGGKWYASSVKSVLDTADAAA